MPQPAGTYTLQLNLNLSLRNRRRLEYEIRQRRVDPADVISAIVADADPLLLSLPYEASPEPAIPMRVYVSQTQRDRFIAFANSNQTDVSTLIAALLAQYLESFPDPPAAVEHRSTNPAEIAAYRRELVRLQAHRKQLRADAPQWLELYIADLEQFLAVQPL
jgi:hypothetical protein